VYPNRVRWFFRQYPLPFHKSAPFAHEAALAAGEQGKSWEMHDLLFEEPQANRARRSREESEAPQARHGPLRVWADLDNRRSISATSIQPASDAFSSARNITLPIKHQRFAIQAACDGGGAFSDAPCGVWISGGSSPRSPHKNPSRLPLYAIKPDEARLFWPFQLATMNVSRYKYERIRRASRKHLRLVTWFG
jgi:hypothetical protein